MKEMLKKIGISEKTINQMEEICPNIKDLTKKEVLNKIEILKNINCDDIQIRNIVSSNAMYLDKSNTDINKLINELRKLGFDNLDLLFDGNPNILNLDDFEVRRYIEDRERNGELLEDIVDDMSSNLFIFEEI
jgi:hypothetical protein